MTRCVEECGDAVDLGLRLLDGPWTLSICIALLGGPLGFSAIRHCVPGVSSKVLAGRLRRLTAEGVVQYRPATSPGTCGLYGLTLWGRTIGGVADALATWGARAPEGDRDGGRGRHAG